MRNFLLLSALLFTSIQPTLAESWSDALDRELQVGFLGWSHHVGKAAEVIDNESHNIIAVEYMGFSAGKFDNSFGRETYFVAKNWRWSNVMDIPDLNGIASLGVNKGYRGCYEDSREESSYCAHGYVGVEYEQGIFVHSLKIQPSVILYNPEVRFDW